MELIIEKLTKEESDKLGIFNKNKYNTLIDAAKILVRGEALRITVPENMNANKFRLAIYLTIRRNCKDITCQIKLINNAVIILRIN